MMYIISETTGITGIYYIMYTENVAGYLNFYFTFFMYFMAESSTDTKLNIA